MKYDPASIRKMAGVLQSIASAAFVFYVIAAVVTVIGSFVTGVGLSQGSPGAAALAVITGMVYGAIIVGSGYLFALGMRVAAQLMLAVVQIEANTAASAGGLLAPIPGRIVGTDASAAAIEPATVATPGELQAMYEAAEQQYADFVEAGPDDAFWDESEAAVAQRGFLTSLQALSDACENQPEDLRTAVARKCRAGFPLMGSDRGFLEIVEEIDI